MITGLYGISYEAQILNQFYLLAIPQIYRLCFSNLFKILHTNNGLEYMS